MTRRTLLPFWRLLVTPASAAPAVDMRIRTPVAAHMTYGDPVPVSVMLTNLGPSCQIRLELRAVGDQGLPEAGGMRGESRVDLPSGARQRRTLLFPGRPGCDRFEVTAWVGRERIARRNLDLDMDYSQDPVTAVLSPDASAFAWLTSCKWGGGPRARGLSVNRPPAEGFPEEAAALAGLDLVVLHDLPRLGLSHGAQRALADWVRAGGRLLLFASPDPGEFRGSPLETLLPLRPAATAPAEGLPLLVGAPDRSQILISRAGLPLLVAGPRVAGVVGLVTTPLPTSDLLGSRATSELFTRFADQCDLLEARFPGAAQDLTLLGDPPELAPPDLALVAWSLLGYVFLVGPVNWMVLRRRDRMLLIFLTVPGVAGGFALLTFLAGWLVRGDEVLLLQSGQTTLVSGQASACWQGSVALYSPRTTTYSLLFPSDLRVREDRSAGPGGEAEGAVVLEQGQQWRDLAFRMWSMRRFQTRGPVLLHGPITVESRNGTVQVANDAGMDLADCRVVLGSQASLPFDLAPGARVAVTPSAGLSAGFLLTGSQHEARFREDRRRLVEGALEAMGRAPALPYLIGWSKGGATSMELQGSAARQATLDMVLVQGETGP